LAPGGNGVVAASAAYLSDPEGRHEAIWNAMLRYRGDTFAVHGRRGRSRPTATMRW
jgi:hypothetical protein